MRILLLFIMALGLGACTKTTPHKHTKKVRVHILEGGATVKFIGQEGQGTYTFTEDIGVLHLPKGGKYWICATYGGGCGGLRVTKAIDGGTENVLLVLPDVTESCITDQELAEEYYASVNCE